MFIINRSSAVGYDLKQAFTYVWSDADFFTKWAIGSFLLVFPTFSTCFPGIKRAFQNPANYGWMLVFAVVSVVIYLAVKGYFYKAVHNNVVHDAEKLPDWHKFWTYMHNGLKAYVGMAIFALPYALVAGGFCYLFRPNFHNPLVYAVGMLVMILFFAFSLPFSLNFATRLRVKAFFSYKRAFWLLKGKYKEYFALYGYCVAIGLGGFILSGLLSMHGMTSLLLPFLGFYVVMVFADLYAQFLNMPAK